MSYSNKLIPKVIKLINNPKDNLGKIIPYLKSKIERLRRTLFEFFGNDKFSKPYQGHSKLLKYINKNNGFFIEVGGNDGYFYDPTYYLEKFKNWKGIIIEPLSVADLCKKNRPDSDIIKKAVVSPNYVGKYVQMIDCNAMSFIQGTIEDEKNWIKQSERCQKIISEKIIVEAETLQSILDKKFKKNERNIDLLVIDVEGYELDALSGLNTEKYQPKYILTEALSEDKFDKLNKLLISKKYKYIDEIGPKDYLFKTEIDI